MFYYISLTGGYINLGVTIKMKENWVWIFIGIIIVFGLIILLGILYEVKSNEPTMISLEEVEFCNNTIFLKEDETGNKIDGQDWISFNNGERFEEVNLSNLKIQKGIDYIWWVESDNFYIEPQSFKAECIDESDTEPQYINFSRVYIKDLVNGTRVKILDDYMLDLGKGTFINIDGESYVAFIRVRYYSSWKGYFMPFGGEMVVESHDYISNVLCADDNYYEVLISEVAPSIIYSIRDLNSKLNVFHLGGTIEKDNPDIKEFLCLFEFYNPDNIEKINSSEFYIKFVPNNFWITKTKEIRLDATKEYPDENYEDYTGFGILEVNGTFEVI